jgi:hypothetical protein
MRHLWARCVRYMYAPFECALREVHVCAVCGRAVLVMTVVGAMCMVSTPGCGLHASG